MPIFKRNIYTHVDFEIINRGSSVNVIPVTRDAGTNYTVEITDYYAVL